MATQAGYRISDVNELKTLKAGDIARVGKDIYRRDLAREQEAMKTYKAGRGTPELNSAFNASVYAPQPATTPTMTTKPTASNVISQLPSKSVSDTINEAFVNSSLSNVETQKKSIMDVYNRQMEEVNRKQAEFDKQIQASQKTQQETLGKMETATQPFQADLEETERERLFINKNFEDNQKSILELETLLNSAVADKEAAQSAPGLASVKQARLYKIQTDYQGRVGVVEAVMNARNSQINVAYGMIDRTVSAINSDRQNQLSYYNLVLGLAQSDEEQAGEKLLTLDKEEKAIIESQLGMVKAQLAESEATAEMIKGLMIDPEYASIVEKAGVSLSDSSEEVAKKIQRYFINNPKAADGLTLAQKLDLYEKGLVLDEKGNILPDISNSTVDQIASAIKQIESGGNYNASGGSGENGAYQFMPATWKSWSSQYNQEVNGVNGALEMTPEKQDAVAKWKIQGWLNQGYSPQQIASMWNSGKPDWEGKVGTNKYGVKYDVPGYVNKFTSALSRIGGVPQSNITGDPQQSPENRNAQNWAKMINDGKTKIENVPAELRSQVVNELATKPSPKDSKDDLIAKEKADLVLELIDHKGLNSSVGPIKGTRIAIGDAFGQKDDFLSKVEQIVSDLSLESLIQAKARGATFGALTDREMRILSTAATAIRFWAEEDKDTGKVKYYDVSESVFKAELKKISDIFNRAIKANIESSIPKTSSGMEYSVESNAGQTSSGIKYEIIK